jgi:hypothetical protein
VDTKPEPVTVSVKASPQAFSDAGAIELSVGPGLLIINVTDDEVPPPGAGVKTVMSREPDEAMSVARIVAVSWVADTNVVVRLEPLTRTTELVVKPVPVAVRVKALPPADTVTGLMLESAGNGAGGTTVNARELEVPPPEPGVADTLTWAVPAPTRSEAETLVLTCVLLT